MSRELLYSFSELPLVIDGGFSAGLVNGQALIVYWTTGEWGITDIYLDGHKAKLQVEIDAEMKAKPGKLPRRFHEKAIALDRDHPLHSIIWGRLEDEWRPYVQAAVSDAIEREREMVS